MILRNGKFSGKILRKMFWKIFRTGKFSTSHQYPCVIRRKTLTYSINMSGNEKSEGTPPEQEMTNS
jgi:hypothetical protein